MTIEELENLLKDARENGATDDTEVDVYIINRGDIANCDYDIIDVQVYGGELIEKNVSIKIDLGL